MHLVRQATTILVPTVRRYFAYQGVSMVVIDFIPGQTLADCWYSLITGVGFGSFTPSLHPRATPCRSPWCTSSGSIPRAYRT